MNKFVILFFSAAALSGCAHGGCNNVPQRPLASVMASPSPSALPSPTPPPAQAATQKTEKGPAVAVFKPTGEKQCGQGAGLPLDEMKDQLTSKKIPVLEAHTQPDGLMHMALCGAPTGNIHVFKIPKRYLKRAERLGFKVFKPRS